MLCQTVCFPTTDLGVPNMANDDKRNPPHLLDWCLENSGSAEKELSLLEPAALSQLPPGHTHARTVERRNWNIFRTQLWAWEHAHTSFLQLNDLKSCTKPLTVSKHFTNTKIINGRISKVKLIDRFEVLLISSSHKT